MGTGLGLRAIKVAAAAADRLRSPGAGVIVLIYHRVGARTAVQVDLPTDLFERQMAVLAASGRVITLDDAVDALIAGTAPDHVASPVVVTFDDGTADFVEEAVPVLVRHGIPATLYLATDFVERGCSFPDDGAPASWGSLGDALTTGLVSIGSHTHTHLLLDRADPGLAASELDRSIELIGERLGVTARHFAYPKAVAGSAAADAAVRARFRSAAVGGARPNRWGASDIYRLNRSAIQVADGMRWYAHKIEGGMVLEEQLRAALNRRRHAGATT